MTDDLYAEDRAFGLPVKRHLVVDDDDSEPMVDAVAGFVYELVDPRDSTPIHPLHTHAGQRD